jgi:methylated-DNA-[protein]-cysteine S-methyltransferase
MYEATGQLTMTHYTTTLTTPMGTLRLSGTEAGLTRLSFEQSIGIDADDDAGPFRDALDQLQEYFAGERERFDLRLDLSGTAFQKAVWTQLMTVPFGQVASYKDIAARMGQPTATRAVGNANGRNPIMIVIPCHRIIAADGGLGGYSSGLDRKRWLLAHESAAVNLGDRGEATVHDGASVQRRLAESSSSRPAWARRAHLRSDSPGNSVINAVQVVRAISKSPVKTAARPLR